MMDTILELSEWFAGNSPPRGFITAFRSGALHRMLELETNPYEDEPRASAWWAGFHRMDSYLLSAGALRCPGCGRVWQPPSRPRPSEMLSLKSWLQQHRPAVGPMFASAFAAGAGARATGASRDSCRYETTWRNTSVAQRLTAQWHAGYDLLGAFLSGGGIIHCPCCWKPWSSDVPAQLCPSSALKHLLVKLLDHQSV